MSVKILVGDCRDVLETMPAGSVQCCVTSPPYFGLRDYGHEGQIGLEQTPDAYVAEMVAVFREVRRVLRDDGTCWLNLGDSYSSGGRTTQVVQTVRGATKRDIGTDEASGKQEYLNGTAMRPPVVEGLKQKDLIGIPWRVAFALQADGWYLRQDIIWSKPNPMPESVTDRCTKAHEYVFLLSKSARYFYDAEAIKEPAAPASEARYGYGFGGAKSEALVEANKDGIGQRTRPVGDREYSGTRNKRSVWPIATQPYSGAHFATMPPELAETCIKAGTSERGQCPHCGAPWARQVESESRPNNRPTGQKHDGTYYAANPGGGVGNDRREKIDRGWAPSCACPAHEPTPQTILDPFGGAGTTALVADRLQRDATIIELNPTYAALARNRINGEAGLFSSVVPE